MVATDWTALSQTALGAAAAIGGGFVGAWLQGRSTERIEAHRRRERSAHTLAEATALLQEADPNRSLFRIKNNDVAEVMGPYLDRQEALRKPLLLLAVGHPSSRVRYLAIDLNTQLWESLQHTFTQLDAVSGEPSLPNEPSFTDEAKLLAERSHAEAKETLDELLKAI